MGGLKEQLVRLSHGENVYDILSARKRWYALSIVVLLICLLGMGVRGLNFSIEFQGGAEFTVPYTVSDTTVAEARDVVESAGLPDMDQVTVTTIGEDTVSIATRSLETPEVAQLREALGTWAGIPPDDVSYRLIGASWGEQITDKAIIALVVFMVLVSVLIAVYFRNWKMSIAAMVAVIHDLVVTVGVYAWVGFSITPSTLTAVLTVLGYSLYDTVVVFDKVRENVDGMKKSRETYTEAANRGLNEVVVRSINTTIIGILPILALLLAGVFVLGTGPIKDLSLAMFVGMIAGAYSSIFIATSLLVDMKEREPAMVAWRKRLDRDDATPGTPVGVGASGAPTPAPGADGPAAPVATQAPPASGTGSSVALGLDVVDEEEHDRAVPAPPDEGVGEPDGRGDVARPAAPRHQPRRESRSQRRSH